MDEQNTKNNGVEAQRQLARLERLAAVGEMVIASAHDSRNALQQIQACLALLEARIEEDAESRELIADLRKAQDQLDRLLQNVLRCAAPVLSEVEK